MVVNYKSWKHVFKLDPNRNLSDEHLERVCLSQSDAILVGGSSDVTFENTVQLLARIRQFEIPCVLEVSNRDAIVPGFDMYFIPVVLNSRHIDYIVGHHHEALKEYGGYIHWDEVATEGYIILNESATVARVTDAKTELDLKEIIAYARMAEHMFHMPIVYIEYSGKFGDMHMLAQVKNHLHHARLFYGGGIDSQEKAKQVTQWVDTIVVGNIIYEDIERALETVQV